MCQGLPCVGASVELIRLYETREMKVPPGTRGVIEQEFLDTREVVVFFSRYNIRLRLSESDVRAVR